VPVEHHSALVHIAYL